MEEEEALPVLGPHWDEFVRLVSRALKRNKQFCEQRVSRNVKREQDPEKKDSLLRRLERVKSFSCADAAPSLLKHRLLRMRELADLRTEIDAIHVALTPDNDTQSLIVGMNSFGNDWAAIQEKILKRLGIRSSIKAPQKEKKREQEKQEQDEQDAPSDKGVSEKNSPVETPAGSDMDEVDLSEEDGPAAKRASSKALNSQFLPSLAAGFIQSENPDEDRWIDDEGDKDDLKIRKNRPGQRARRALAEKKYGKKANHLRKDAERDDSYKRRDESDSYKRRHEIDDSSKRRHEGDEPRRKERRFEKVHHEPTQRDQHDRHPSAKPKDEKAPELHPSWAVKQRQKELMSQAAPAKKIVFD